MYHLLINSPVGEEMVALLPRMNTMVIVLYFGLFAMSFDFISGYSGYLSFGHGAFYGTGAYLVVFIANNKVPLLGSATPFMASLFLAGLLAAALAVLIGLVAFRLTGVYFAMITLGVAEVLHVFVRNWDYVGSNPRDGAYVLEHPEGFAIGVPGIDALNLRIGRLTGDTVQNFLGLGVEFSTTEVSYYMVGLVVLIAYLAMQRIIHSPFGRVMIAIRENEERAEAVGYHTLRYKIGAFAISAFFAGIAGALFAGYARSVAPENTFFFLVTGFALLAAIIGGFGTLAGPLFGWFFYQTLNEFLTKEGGGLLPYLRANLGEGTLGTELAGGLTLNEFIEVFLNGHASLYIGIVFVLFVLYVPHGLLGTLRVRLGGPLASELPKRLAALWEQYRHVIPGNRS
ncbi:MAG: branched-chain amino acid ABC transporter permease [Halobacteriales archaeon]